MNNKGFAISGIVYSILILFLILIFSILAILGSRKLIIDKLKSDVMSNLNDEDIDKRYTDNSGANPPELLNNMVPIVYNGTNWIYANVSKKWYDYNKLEWANAVVLKSEVSKKVGDVITEDDISLWYVWIPRYKYTLFNANNGSVNEVEIEVEFESGKSSTGTVKCTSNINVSGNNSEICKDNYNTVVTNKVSTYTHPAFMFGNQELSGFWVGKFEISGTINNITIKPNLVSLRNQTVASFFQGIQNISKVYGIIGDSHMIKNMEWGAVAYLKQSKYGLGIGDIGVNNNSSYITGCGSLPESSASSSCNKYDTSNGVKASTTGNIYGVYDMSGGSFEYVMANMINSSNQFYPSASGFSNSINSKYYDSYSYSTSETTHGRGKLGDATKEILKKFGNNVGGWYNDSTYFPFSTQSWFLRSGYYESPNVGIFYFGKNTGVGVNNTSTRAVLTPNS